jgi:hypothetical protein
MIAEVLALVADAEVLGRIGGSLGEAARDRQREIATLDEKASRALRASWLAMARVPITPNLRGIDASWIEAAITRPSTATRGSVEELARQLRRVLLDGPTTAVDVWLARFACAAFPPMPAVDGAVTRPRSIEQAISMTAANLRAWLEEVGADQIAFAVGKAAGAPTSRLGVAAVRIQQAPRVGELGERRAAIERARIALDEDALVRVGARSIAPHANALERMQIAHRLPMALRLRDEMESFAAKPGAPSWQALAAP